MADINKAVESAAQEMVQAFNDAVFEIYGIAPAEVKGAMSELMAYRSAATLEQVQADKKAREEGRLVELPCKVGDTIFTPYAIGGIKETRIDTIDVHIDKSGVHEYDLNGMYLSADDIPKAVFFTREEAESAHAALEKEGKG